ncbi:hypothetical protein SEA_BOOMERJR_184 [Streptomyces phage BoomerJR]|uniref:Uncharacterized protein n=1 Tax=Streptomyces phage BoomerJR TaxID=2502449 RepID=A0A411CFZ4_9CAUD|nr:hypothetical protein SEA_BOOMERJR_184 [Streptomyces phage BoomerJR]
MKSNGGRAKEVDPSSCLASSMEKNTNNTTSTMEMNAVGAESRKMR